MVSFVQPQSTFGDFSQRQVREKKVLLVANTGWYLYNFRLPLAKALRSQGATVVLISPWDSYVEKLQEEGFWWIELDLNRRSVNPFLEIYAILRLLLIYLVEKPDIVHHFTIKCVIYGTLAAKMSGIKSVINAITGLGYVFINNQLKARLLRLVIKPLYFLILNAKRCRVIVQNQDDLDLLVQQKLVSLNKIDLIKSSGVNLQRFKPRRDQRLNGPVSVLLASRIVGDKGVYEYVAAAKQLKQKGYAVTFKLAGGLYLGNPTAVSEEALSDWSSDGTIEWLGHVDDIENVILDSDIVILPSHGGEGVPKILIESAAAGKPLVATDVSGCRDVIESGITGYLVPPKDADALASAIESLVNDADLRDRMGIAGRAKVSAEFDVKIVIKKTLDVYKQMGFDQRVKLPKVVVSHYKASLPTV